MIGRIGFAAAMLMAAVTAAQTFPEIIPEGLGVNIHFTDPKPGEMEMLAAGGFKIVRMDFHWGGIERKKGEYDFSAYDRLMAHLDQRNIRALFILDYGNTLYDDGLAPATEEARQAFARWAGAAVTHFKGRGILWEMWNEPNIKQFWKPAPSVEAYAKLALATGQAIRAAGPQEVYIGPATAEIDMKFLEGCFQAGLLEYWSAVSVHPYRQKDPETVVADYAKLRALIAKYAPAGKTIPIVSGEWGYSVAWKEFSEERQGKYLSREWLINLAEGVPVSIWYDWHDDGVDAKEPEHHFGTVRHALQAGKDEVYEPKPSYRAACTLTGELRGCRFASRVETGKGDEYVLRFVSVEPKGGDRWVVWTTAKEKRTIDLALPPGNYRMVGHTGQMLQRNADAKGLTVEATDAPVFIRGL